MEDLEKLRKEINKIDEKLVDCFKKRMKIVKKVADYKIENSMKVLDKNREEKIINKHLNNIEDEDLKISTEEFLKNIMSISRKCQKEIIHKYNDKRED